MPLPAQAVVRSCTSASPVAASKLRMVFDFDGTITAQDTISELAESAIGWQSRRAGQDARPAWDRAVRAYLDDYDAYMAAFQPSEPERTSIDQEKLLLAGLKSVEEASLTRVSQSGLFAGLQRHHLARMGSEAVSSGRIQVTRGFKALCDAAAAAGPGAAQPTVLSVHWSAAFIGGALGQPGVCVIANEVSEDGHINGPSPGASRLTTSADKARALGRILDGPERLVYFGDSATDLECLLWCRGIVVAKQEERSPLLKTLARLGLAVPHVGQLRHHAGKRLFWARDFQEVLESDVLAHFQLGRAQDEDEDEDGST
ncbi:uncharacterized protein UV8b_02523 [Ustilaginoidea virens]|uniref:Uncharacterized protein n=1 Tax=Ustilaginoidea virens TaxID=1159556 RepID=A0A063BWR3_USTVR|nr:uncharacterized protein UV8b_02523 [Ustilaginoidea virens]QUC18282.1 hypothetical protein UV8b_02523 [Ustilaginoidea virens]GAO16124.1 hypothetical protein UVI_02040190 [Ustilaginoidea virens]